MLRRAWHSVRGRILGGHLLVLPILITFWVIYNPWTGQTYWDISMRRGW